MTDLAVFSAKAHDHTFLRAEAEKENWSVTFFEERLRAETAVLAHGAAAVSPFVHDRLDRAALAVLAEQGTQLIALRCAGYNNVDLDAAEALGLTVTRVPAYSPHAVAEHTLALLMALNRRIHRAHMRVREGDFSLEGLLGYDMHDKTAGVMGTGRIGRLVAHLLLALGCRVLATDVQPDEALQRKGVEYVDRETIFAQSDVLTLHCPLTPETHHMINAERLAAMKQGVVLVNTSRGALVETSALIDGLKSGRVGAVALDVYEEEADVFFENLSNEVIQDDRLMRLTTFPNVLVTSHQAFFTREAVTAIARTTLQNLAPLRGGAVPEANRLVPRAER